MQRVQQKSFKMQIKRKLCVQLEWSAIAMGRWVGAWSCSHSEKKDSTTPSRQHAPRPPPTDDNQAKRGVTTFK